MNSHSVAQEPNILQLVSEAYAQCTSPQRLRAKQWDFDYPALDLAHCLQGVDNGWYFRDENGLEQGGLGIARRWKWPDLEGFAKMDRERKSLVEQGLAKDTVIAGGFAFGPSAVEDRLWTSFDYTQWILPALSITQAHGQAHIRITLFIQPGEDPSILASDYQDLWRIATNPPNYGNMPAVVSRNLHPSSETWMNLVRLATRAIQDKQLEKVVVARRSDTLFSASPPISTILSRLQTGNPHTTVFALRYDGYTFLGATPERLVTVVGREVTTMALAGTFPRGKTFQKDAVQMAKLLSSPKDLREHAAVVRNITSVLAPYARLRVPESPQILSLANVHHLWTPIEGTLRTKMSLLSLALLLHPTPAVGGEPKMAAKQWIKHHEGLVRGWYAGGVGTFDLNGNGSLWVALRSALIRGSSAYCFAGCGIMADSSPESELDESEWKLQAMLKALGVKPS
jgi:isochorismate synthase